MKYGKFILLLAALLLLPFALKVHGQDFGQGQSLFADIKAHKVGDILTVLIYEQLRASNQVETKTENKSSSSTEVGPGLGTLDFIPFFAADADHDNSHNGKGENLRSGDLRAKMSVTVVAAKDNGDLIIQGSRTIGISGDRETITLTGTVRQKDITPNNTVDSYLIADAEISYSGKGNADQAAKPGIFTRILNWIF
jgi:flagellar L-ring protein precursor FlgH